MSGAASSRSAIVSHLRLALSMEFIFFSCCAPVQLKDGMLASGTVRVPFKLAMAKAGDLDHPNRIGLIAATPVAVGVQAGQVMAKPDRVMKTGWGDKTEMKLGGDPAPFIFSDDRKAFTLCEAHCRTEYQFVRRLRAMSAIHPFLPLAA